MRTIVQLPINNNIIALADRIRRTFQDGTQRWVSNYLNYDVNNFSVDERGSLQEIMEAQQEHHEVNDENFNDGDIL